MWNCIFPLVRCQLVYLTYAKQPDWFIVMNIIYLLKKFYSRSRWLCMSLMNLNYSLVYFKALHKKVNIFWCLYDCLAPPNGWLIFLSRDQLRFISYLNVYTRLNNNWFSRSGNCTKCGINYHKKTHQKRIPVVKAFTIISCPCYTKKDYFYGDWWEYNLKRRPQDISR